MRHFPHGIATMFFRRPWNPWNLQKSILRRNPMDHNNLIQSSYWLDFLGILLLDSILYGIIL